MAHTQTPAMNPVVFQLAFRGTNACNGRIRRVGDEYWAPWRRAPDVSQLDMGTHPSVILILEFAGVWIPAVWRTP